MELDVLRLRLFSPVPYRLMKFNALLVSVVVVLGMSLTALVAISVLRPEVDTAVLTGHIITFAGPTLTALLALISSQRNSSKLDDIHTRMDKMSDHDEKRIGQDWQDADDPERRTLD